MIKSIKRPYDDCVELFIFGGSYSSDLRRIMRDIEREDLVTRQGVSRRVIHVKNASNYLEVPYIAAAFADASRQLVMF